MPRPEPRSEPRPEPRPDPRPDPRPEPRDRPNVALERKSDDYVQRLEWRDRCFRSCLKY